MGSKEWFHAVGNQVADKWAKKGADAHPSPKQSDRKERGKLDSMVEHVCKWIGTRCHAANTEGFHR